jgi:acetolactate synthase I/II/III large subunit
MAEAYGFLTGRPGVCMSTLGPGSSNLVNAVANAYLDRVPMIALSGQIERKRAQTFTHQVLDHNRLFSSVSKWTTELAPDTVAGVMRRALRTAVAERPGPVHITTHADVVGEVAKDAAVALPPLSAVSAGLQAFGRDADVAKRLTRREEARAPRRHRRAARGRASGACDARREAPGCRWWSHRWQRASSPRTTRITPARSTWRAMR